MRFELHENVARTRKRKNCTVVVRNCPLRPEVKLRNCPLHPELLKIINRKTKLLRRRLNNFVLTNLSWEWLHCSISAETQFIKFCSRMLINLGKLKYLVFCWKGLFVTYGPWDCFSWIARRAICYGKASGFWGFGNQIWEACIERTVPWGESVVVAAWLLFVTMIEAAFQDIHVLRAIAAINHSGNFISGCHFTLSILLNLSTVAFLRR